MTIGGSFGFVITTADASESRVAALVTHQRSTSLIRCSGPKADLAFGMTPPATNGAMTIGSSSATSHAQPGAQTEAVQSS